MTSASIASDGYRGRCDLPRFREQEIAEKMGHVLEHVQIPEEIARAIELSLERVHVQARGERAQEGTRLGRELNALDVRMDSAYIDKLDGKISEEFWQRKQADWAREELRINSLVAELNEDKSDERLLNMHRILELAQRAYSLYVTQKTSGTSETLKKCTFELRY
jgi:hypothetical protein